MHSWAGQRLGLPRRNRSGWLVLALAGGGRAAAADQAVANVTAANEVLASSMSALWWLVGAAAVIGGLALFFWRVQQRALARERERLSQARELELQKLAATQARQAKETADAANRAKGEFLATMSHEIRTPLNGVIGSAELMLETSLNAQQREYMTTIRSSAEALLAIVNDILDFSKIEAGKVVLDHTMFDLRQPVIDVMKIASARVGNRDLELVLDVAPDVPACVYGDPARLRQVLLNLVSNAVKFTTKGHVLVRVARVPDDSIAPRVWLRFEVNDTGIGIPAETRVRLFEKFTQADASTTRKFGGTGLGLAISKRIIDLMGGQIGLESDPGHGSQFWFNIPLQVDEMTVPKTTAPAGRVLVADDLPAAAQALARLLGTMNVRATAVSSAADALARWREADAEHDPYELILVDQSLALAGERELLKSIARLPDAPAPALVLLAPANYIRDTAAPIGPEFAALVVKPVLQADQLIEAFREVREGAARQAAGNVPPEVMRLSRKGLKVLVAEDNNVNRVVVGGMLKKLGCQVEFAENGAEAVAKTRLSSHDIIFMDCLMPEMDGWSATLEIRRLDSRTPIVATTANATADDRSRCMKVGMNDYLSKPLRLADMVKVMERWVG